MERIKVKAVTISSKGPDQTEKFGRLLGANLSSGDVLALIGGLGAGKTVLARGIAVGLGVRKRKVKSPSFVLVNEYAGRLPLYHLDFYRIDEPQELERLGLEEYIFGDGAAVIEWADKIEHLLGEDYLRIELLIRGEKERLIRLTAFGKQYQRLLKKLNQAGS